LRRIHQSPFLQGEVHSQNLKGHRLLKHPTCISRRKGEKTMEKLEVQMCSLHVQAMS
jgi:hypothetical protein